MRDPVTCLIDLGKGLMHGATGHYRKRLSDLAGLYEDETSFGRLLEASKDAVVYEVTEFRPSEDPGDMIFGVTRMTAGRVGREYFLTRGHIHANANRPEVYYGQKGHGVMLMQSRTGETRALEILPNTVCYVPPYWIHRSVNVGADELIMLFSYPADAGQNYDVIEEAGGMRSRVIDDGRGGWVMIENRRYRAPGENVGPHRKSL